MLIDGAKIGGCLMPAKYEEAAGLGLALLVNLGVGGNLAATPPEAAIRQKATVTGATCLKDHGVDIGIAAFVSLFEERFEALRQECRHHGFTHILQKIGFADRTTGKITLHSLSDDGSVSGHYRGFRVENCGDGFYVGYLQVATDDKTIRSLPLGDYTARAVIKAPAVVISSASQVGYDCTL
jgi:biotin-(acetyl-CoA carboxylase) ligase